MQTLALPKPVFTLNSPLGLGTFSSACLIKKILVLIAVPLLSSWTSPFSTLRNMHEPSIVRIKPTCRANFKDLRKYLILSATCVYTQKKKQIQKMN